MDQCGAVLTDTIMCVQLTNPSLSAENAYRKFATQVDGIVMTVTLNLPTQKILSGTNVRRLCLLVHLFSS